MTIEVEITNLDTARTIQVRGEEVPVPGRNPRTGEYATLGPGQTTRVHVHAAKSISIIELPDAPQPKAAAVERERNTTTNNEMNES